MATESQSESDQGGSSSNQGGESLFECNICFETAVEPVITVCGHLFCWSCLYKWLQTQPQSPVCPVCKAGVEKDKIIPIYARGGSSKKFNPDAPPTSDASDASADDIPSRPAGQRPEPRHQYHNHGPFMNGPFMHQHQFNGFQFSAGFGFFPPFFGFSSGNPFGNNAAGGRPREDLTPQQLQSAFLSRLLFTLGALVLLAVLFS